MWNGRKTDGMCKFTNNSGIESYKSEGPFEQARTAMHSILDTLSNMKSRNFVNDFVWDSGVMFPDIRFDVESIEYSLDQVYDKKYKGNIKNYIRNLSDYYKNKLNFQSKYYFTKEKATEIVEILKADFVTNIHIKDSIAYSEEIITELTEEQYHVIDGLSYNDRCLIHGGAGTGKTVLSVKLMNDAIKNNEKRLCSVIIYYFQKS